MNENVVAETLVIGRGLTDETFGGKRHGVKIPEFVTINMLGSIHQVIYAVKEHITRNAGANPALLLSGGKDSRVIAALMKSVGVNPICITFSYNESDPEVRAARKVCRKLRFEHKFIKINPRRYFEEDLIELTDGNPNYFPMMLFYQIRHELDYDAVFTGELMTEFMDTGEYRWYEGDIRYALAGKELLLPIIDQPFYMIIQTKLLSMYSNNDINRVIVERKLDRLIYLKLWKKYINFVAPATDEKVLSAVMSLPLKERVSSRLTRNILRMVNPELLMLPTARSPFSLRFPLWLHQIYQKLSKRTVGIGGYMPSFISIDDLVNIDLDFIDKKRLRAALLGKLGNRAKNAAYERMLNLKVWVDKHGY